MSCANFDAYWLTRVENITFTSEAYFNGFHNTAVQYRIG